MKHAAFLLLLWLSTVVPTRAANVYLTNSSDGTHDITLASILSNGGHSVTLGAPWYNLDGSQDLSEIDVVILQANYNWNNGDMPETGQIALKSFVEAGGGLLTSAWLNYNIEGDTDYDTLRGILPVTNPESDYEDTSEVTFSLVARNPVVVDGLSNTFLFTPQSIDGTESRLLPKRGAVVYCASSTRFSNGARGSGVVGWLYGQGRVACFSTICGADDFVSPDFRKLFLNMIHWTRQADSKTNVKISGGSSPKFKSPRAKVKGTARDAAGIYTVTYQIDGKGSFRSARGTTSWQFTTKLKKRRTKAAIRVTNGNGVVTSKNVKLVHKG